MSPLLHARSNGHSTAELHVSVLIGKASHPDMQKTQKIGIFFENSLHRQFEVHKKNSTKGCFRLHIYLSTNKKISP